MNMTGKLERLQQACSGVKMRCQEPLAEHTSFRIGGPADLMLFPSSEEELAQILRACQRLELKPVILGAGTNVLAPDEGLRGAVICTRDCLTGMERRSETEIAVKSGVTLAKAAMYAYELGLTGLEFAQGIPGTVGGGVYMNAGAYGGEIRQVAVCTTVLLPDGTEKTFAAEAQAFSYRHSAFMETDCVITRTVFRLTPGDRTAIKARMKELADRRCASQPLELPSAGSTFKRPVGGYAAALIQQAGLKGFRVGGAAISEKHAGFVVNCGGATAQDVLSLMEQVQQRVYDHSGIRLEPEVRILTNPEV